jgi:hypothetical protein
MKRCKKCGLNKSTIPGKADFYDDPEARDGLRGTCKWCMNDDAKARYRIRTLTSPENSLRPGLAGDPCAEIIHLVRSARDRGIAVQELEPDSKSELLTRCHVLTIPTVLIMDGNGQVVSRFEGEGRDTVKAVRARLEQLQ